MAVAALLDFDNDPRARELVRRITAREVLRQAQSGCPGCGWCDEARAVLAREQEDAA